MNHFVFVYGTLRRGEGNSRLLKGSRCLGVAVTAGTSYKMNRHEGSTVPYVSDGGTSAVLGEVWCVDDATFRRLDFLEGHPNFYRRIERWFWTYNPVQRVRGWIYLYDNPGAPPVRPVKGLLRAPTSLELFAKAEF